MAGQFQYDSLPVVETKAGKLRGYQWEGTYIFKGIRYARAKRFQLPEEAEPWEGVREAASYGFVCPMLTRDNPQGELLVPPPLLAAGRGLSELKHLEPVSGPEREEAGAVLDSRRGVFHGKLHRAEGVQRRKYE